MCATPPPQHSVIWLTWYCSPRSLDLLKILRNCLITQMEHLLLVAPEDWRAPGEKGTVPSQHLQSCPGFGLPAVALGPLFQVLPSTHLNASLFLITCFPLTHCLPLFLSLSDLLINLCTLRFAVLCFFIPRKCHLLIMQVILTSWHHLDYSLLSYK